VLAGRPELAAQFGLLAVADVVLRIPRGLETLGEFEGAEVDVTPRAELQVARAL
jgi:hypothetical protein